MYLYISKWKKRKEKEEYENNKLKRMIEIKSYYYLFGI
jgi:hypothetical protein